jgi:transcriptional antiterminator Rof (Rho-off)
MLRRRLQVLIIASSLLFMVLHLAHASIPGKVTAIDDNGMVTIETDDGDEHEVKIDGLHVGDRVEYAMQEQDMVTITTRDGREHQSKAADLQMSNTTDCAEKNAAGECPKK